MARFSVREQQTRPQSQRATGADFGALEGQALSRLGEAAGQAVDVFQQLDAVTAANLKKAEEAEELNVARQITSDTQIQLLQDIQDIQLNADPSGAGHVNNVIEHVDSKWDELIEGSEGKVREYYVKAKAQSRGKIVPGEITFQSKKRGENRIRTETDLRNKELNALYSNPALLNSMLSQMGDRIQGYQVSEDNPYGISQNAVVAAYDANKQDYYNSAAKGMVDNSSTLAELTAIEKKWDKAWQDNLTSDSYLALNTRIERKRKQIENEGKVELAAARSRMSETAKDYAAYLADGNAPERPEGLSDDDIRGTMEPEDAEELITDISRFETATATVNNVMSGSAEDAAAIAKQSAESVKEGSEDYRDKAAVDKIVQDSYKARLKALEDAPADYAVQQSDLLKKKAKLVSDAPSGAEKVKAQNDFTDALIEEQRRLGVNEYNIDVLTSSQVDFYKDMFTSSMVEEGENLYIAVQKIKENTGQHFARAMQQLVDVNAAPVGMTVIADLSDINPTAASMMAEGLKNKKDNIDALGLKKDDYSTRDELLEYTSTFGGDVLAGAAREVNEIISATEALAIQYMIGGYASSDAVEKAAEDTVYSRYDVSGTIRVPKSLNADPDDISIQSRVALSQFGFRYSDKVDWSKVESLYGEQAPLDERQFDVVYSIEMGNARVITAPDDSGLLVVTNTGAPLPSVDGGFLVIPWSEVQDIELLTEEDVQEYGVVP